MPDQELLRHKELVLRAARWQKQNRICFLAFLLLSFSFCWINVIYTGNLAASYWVAVGGILLSLLLYVVVTNYLAKRLALVCKYCGGLLTQNVQQIAVATGRCAHCGEPLVVKDG